MSNRTLTDAVSSKPILGKGLVKWESFAMRYTRFALGAAFLSAVAGRFGIWGEGLLVLFGTAMAISLGIKTPLDYSVFSASAGALLLAICQIRKAGGNVSKDLRHGQILISNGGDLRLTGCCPKNDGLS